MLRYGVNTYMFALSVQMQVSLKPGNFRMAGLVTDVFVQIFRKIYLKYLQYEVDIILLQLK